MHHLPVSVSHARVATVDDPVTALRRGNRRKLLRLATAAAHDALEAKIGRFRDLQAYRRYLLGMHAFRRDMERGLEEFCTERWPHWHPTLLTACLAADLNDLGLVQMPCKRTSCIEDAAEHVIGVLYVLEGSSLGARLLVNDASDVGLRADYGARHLHHQNASPRAWKSFLEILENEVPLDMEQVVTAAQATFGRAGQAFDEVER